MHVTCFGMRRPTPGGMPDGVTARCGLQGLWGPAVSGFDHRLVRTSHRGELLVNRLTKSSDPNESGPPASEGLAPSAGLPDAGSRNHGEPAVEAAPDVKTLRAAAERGDRVGQYQLALTYLNGKGVSQDAQEAVRWLRCAAEQGLPEAQDGLGVRFSVGDGVVQDDREALLWFRRAAEQGYAVAQFNLALAYAQGRGTEVDMIEAYAWFCLCAEQGDVAAAGAVDTIVETLTLEELRRARGLFNSLYLGFHPTRSAASAESARRDI